VEDTLNALLDAETGQLCNAVRYERTQARRYTWAGVGRLQQASSDAGVCAQICPTREF